MSKVSVTSLNDLSEPFERAHGKKYKATHYRPGERLGVKKLGFNLTVLPPGKTAFPYHFHHVNEEVFLVLEGEGTLRGPEGNQPIRKNDLIFCPTGPDGAHQLTNTGTLPLQYLALSTLQDPEVTEYPDSGKYGVVAGRPSGGKLEEATRAIFAKLSDAVDYWSGESS